MDEVSSTSAAESTSPGGPNKMILASIVIVILLLGIGGYYVMSKNATSSPTSTVAPTNAPTAANAFTSIQDALSKSVSLQCEYTDESGRKTLAYIKAGAVRTDMTGKTPEENGSVIMKDKKMYFWNGKQGIMMEFDVNQMAKNVPSGSPTTQKSSPAPKQEDGANVMESLEKFREHCKPAVVDDALFVPPADVKFQDFSKMMPSGAPVMQQNQTTPTP